MNRISLRRARPAEAAELHSLIRQAMAFYARDSKIRTALDSDQESVTDLAVHIQHDIVLVAEEEGQLVGTVRLVRQNKDTAWFTRFAVLPRRQGSGIGRQLLAAATRLLLQDGCRQLLLHTALSNQQLVDFYQARGFRLVHSSNERGYPRGLFLKWLDKAQDPALMEQGADSFVDQGHNQRDDNALEQVERDENKDDQALEIADQGVASLMDPVNDDIHGQAHHLDIKGNHDIIIDQAGQEGHA